MSERPQNESIRIALDTIPDDDVNSEELVLQQEE